MATGSFRVGQRLRLDGELCRIHRDLGQGKLILERLSTGQYQEHSIPDLLRRWETGELLLESGGMKSAQEAALHGAYQDAFHQSYPAEELEQAKARLVYVQGLRALPRTQSLMAGVIEEIWKNELSSPGRTTLSSAPHPATVARWIRNYEAANDDIRSLMARHSDKGNHEERIHEVVGTMVQDAIELEYLTSERPPLKELWRSLKGQVALRNKTRLPSEQLRPPSYKYLKARVQELPAYDVYRARYGQRAADIKFRAAGANFLASRPLSRASMDHTRLDLFVVDAQTFLPLGRPWLTLVIDEYSRYVLGYYIGFEEPSNVSMSRAVKHAIAPKTLSPNVKQSWDAWGAMEVLVVDNGLEFHGRALEAGAGRYGINIQFCPRKKPWFKGKVERFFGTLNTGLLAAIQGKTFASVLEKGDYNPAKNAVITLATLREVVETWIVDVYHHSDHRGLGCTPAQSWSAGLTTIDCGCDGPCSCAVDRYLPASSIEMMAAFSHSTTRVLTHKGIEHDTILYNSDELGALRALHGERLTVEIRVQSDDLGAIVVVAPDQKTLLKVPALDQAYAAGLTSWQHAVCKRYRRRLQEDDNRQIGLLDAKQRIKELIRRDVLAGSRTKTRVKQQRFQEEVLSARVTPSSAAVDAADDTSLRLNDASSLPAPIRERSSPGRPMSALDSGGVDEDAVPDFDVCNLEDKPV